jgi:PAS domain S-box-containing protein
MKDLMTTDLSIREHWGAQDSAAELAAIVESSDDAILSKNLDGIILSWNKGAERLFGYRPEEVIGKHISILIPEERADEEPRIIGRISRGERVEHYETVRVRKDGSPIDISLTVSPVRGADGTIIGASKIARDITERRRAQDRQALLLREMSHRVKNAFALATSVVTLSARSAATPAALAATIRERLAALARAHDLTLPNLQGDEAKAGGMTNLVELLKTIFAPYREDGKERIVITGCDVPVGRGALAGMALLLHEFATNATKYGALSVPEGLVKVDVVVVDDEMRMIWTEIGGPEPSADKIVEGFGSRLERATVQGQLHGSVTRDWQRQGLVIRLAIPLSSLAD